MKEQSATSKQLTKRVTSDDPNFAIVRKADTLKNPIESGRLLI